MADTKVVEEKTKTEEKDEKVEKTETKPEAIEKPPTPPPRQKPAEETVEFWRKQAMEAAKRAEAAEQRYLGAQGTIKALKQVELESSEQESPRASDDIDEKIARALETSKRKEREAKDQADWNKIQSDPVFKAHTDEVIGYANRTQTPWTDALQEVSKKYSQTAAADGVLSYRSGAPQAAQKPWGDREKLEYSVAERIAREYDNPQERELFLKGVKNRIEEKLGNAKEGA